MLVIFAYESVQFFFDGQNLYQDLPDEETKRMPESTLLYVIYLACFACNTLFLIVFLYVVTYIALMTYQLRGVIFEYRQDDQT